MSNEPHKLPASAYRVVKRATSDRRISAREDDMLADVDEYAEFAQYIADRAAGSVQS